MEPIRKDGRRLSLPEAAAEFRDRTARPGPLTWELSAFPPGTEDLPVTGVSWYEAAAYAAFAGESLPTLHEWNRAAGISVNANIVTLSNFGAKGPAAGGSRRGMSPFGSFDMAGNAKEWTSWSHDVGRTLEYLDARGDIDMQRLGFAPRVKTPVLMVNGRYDFLFPLETNQIPPFRALGPTEPDKKRLLFDGGHRNLVDHPTTSGVVFEEIGNSGFPPEMETRVSLILENDSRGRFYYSIRSAITGSILVARRAGNHEARTATTRSVPETAR